MTTEVTTPVGRGAPARYAPIGLSRPLPVTERCRPWVRRTALALTALALAVAVVVIHVRSEAETAAARAALPTAAAQLRMAQGDLSTAQRRLAAAQSRHRSVTGSFDRAGAALAATQATVAKDDAGIYRNGIDLGKLDSCLSAVEQALNQLAVGQTTGGLASLRASSPSCAALNPGA